ncbi:MAG: FKBP-type peptidyl-prolyl cis-trans isomerase [Tannerella sp.]|jgi:FKBP-type peptidyl-prolyl cis-trans isomerase SlyD|nr:FKBP-type peptidyl-prolyl cis-trans isomerase [Tannerella sp.]
MKIATDRYVSVMYDLNTGNGDERELKERATAEHPLEFIFGSGNMLPAFEARLKGLEADETFQFSLSPEHAYGEYVEENVVELPKKIFETDGKFDDEFVREGNVLPMEDSEGYHKNGTVMKVDTDTVVMNFNHPLAGETLHFSGKVLNVRQATAEDLVKLGGCSCDSEDSACNCGCGCC